MSECKYCNFLPNGDIPDGRKSIFFSDSIKLPLITIDSVVCGENSHMSKELEMSLDIGIYNTEAGKQMGLSLWSNELQEVMATEANLSGDIFNTDIGIKYCPMCGRKLKP